MLPPASLVLISPAIVRMPEPAAVIVMPLMEVAVAAPSTGATSVSAVPFVVAPVIPANDPALLY